MTSIAVFFYSTVPKSLSIIAVVGVLASMTGCTSTKGYFVDRGNDVLDIVTIGIEKNSIGITAQAGPAVTGLNVRTANDKGCKGIGLRGGHVGVYNSFDYEFILAGLKFFQPDNDDLRRKGYAIFQMFSLANAGQGFISSSCKTGYEYGNVELSVSLGFGIRAGMNMFEIVDLLLGSTTIDIFADDLEAKKQNEKKGNNKI